MQLLRFPNVYKLKRKPEQNGTQISGTSQNTYGISSFEELFGKTGKRQHLKCRCPPPPLKNHTQKPRARYQIFSN